MFALQHTLVVALIWGAVPSADLDSMRSPASGISVELAQAAPAPVKKAKPSQKKPAATKPTVKPATVRETTKVIDLRKLERLKPVDPDVRGTATELRYDTQASIKEAYNFHTQQLSKAGWKAPEGPGQNIVTDEYAQTSFLKRGFLLSFSIIKSGEPVSVTLTSHGNVDTRQLPVPAGASVLYGSQLSTILVTSAKVAEAADACTRALQKQGWQSYVPAHAAQVDDPNQKLLLFRQNGTALTVSVGVAPAQGGKTTMQYGVSALNFELPTPPDATAVEFNDFTPVLICQSPSSVEKVVQFYRDTFPPLGWKPRDKAQASEQQTSLFFEGTDGSLMLLQARPGEDGTGIKIEYLSPEMVAKLNKPKDPEPAPTEKPAGKPVYARQLPLPKDARDVKYAAEASEITFNSRSEIKTVVEFYRKQLAKDWKEDKNFSVVEQNAGVVSFKKGDIELSFQMLNLGLGGGTDVTIHGEGLSWDKAEAEPKPEKE